MRWRSVLLSLAFGLAAGYAIAQTGLSSQTLTGNETMTASVGGPQGSSFFVPVSQLRNATAIKTFSGSGAQTYTATNNDSTLYWVGTAPTTFTVTTPATPYDGEILTLATDTTLTTMVTLTANTGQSLNSTYTNQTITAKTSVEFQYSATTTKWYELR